MVFGAESADVRRNQRRDRPIHRSPVSWQYVTPAPDGSFGSVEYFYHTGKNFREFEDRRQDRHSAVVLDGWPLIA